MAVYKKALDGITPFTPAKSLESVRRVYGLDNIIKLAGNENNHGYSPAVKEALLGSLSEITRYPDPNTTLLREKLASHLGVAENELLFGNGSFELITLVANAFLEEGTEAVVPSPSFAWYTVAAKTANAMPVFSPLAADYSVDLDAVLERITGKTRVLWICNPNNPTGGCFDAVRFEGFMRKVSPDVLVVLDEAYIDFAGSDMPCATELVKRYGNFISLRTFSKVYGLAALRMGYAIGSSDLIEKISRIRSPCNVNAPAQAAALAALGDRAFYDYVVAENERGKALYYERLKRLNLRYIPTKCNFITFETGIDSAEVASAYLKRGILIREGREFGMPLWIRVTIGTDSENRKALDILEDLLTERRKSPE
jgi:histidinol-phosphate aminotransferase